MCYLCLYRYLQLRSIWFICTGLVLNEFVRHFEPLYFDPLYLKDEQTRMKRSLRRTNKSFARKDIVLNITSYNRLFRLRFRTSNNVFTSDAVFESTRSGYFHYDTDNVLNGYLEDEEDSDAHGVLTSTGLFDGLIRTRTDAYFIEPADRYFSTNNKDFHSIMYRLSDVQFPYNLSLCFLRHTWNPSERQHTIYHSENKVKCDPFEHYFFRQSESNNSSNKYLFTKRFIKSENKRSRRATATESNLFWRDIDSLHYGADSEPYGVRAVQRTHWPEDRHDRHVVIDPKKTTCMLYLQADHLFFEKMGSEEACIETMTRHVQKVNNIYRSTDFDQDGRSDNISFLIKRIKVHTSDALKDPEYRFPGNYGVEKFLELFSEEDYDAFCLAYMFTYRDFEGGTLGLAWTGDLKNAGGVCEKNGHYRGSLKSLNTGIITLLNYGKHVPPIVSHVTLAHEIGHNFGSPHDPEDDKSCTPGGESGNYIMFARATSGDKLNNNKFSPCSLKSINAVLNTKARSLKGCFQEPQDSICGNEVVEAGEECDCGWEEDCTEPCCFPMRSNPPLDEIPCRLRPNVVCSPSQGPCCTQDCRLKGPQCPPSTNKPNKTICNDEFVCYMGECTGSICIAYGLESCQCQRRPNDPDTKSCELCCRLPSDDSSCKSSFEWNTPPYDVPDLYAKPGTPCDNYNGYCDVFQKCREVDPAGPLATLRRLLLSNESMASIKKWLHEQWICVLLLGVMSCLIV
ncbi:hypothetical protein B4U80_09883, partial [Leptotrombidium deliense]